jgi:hypothetical protein
MYFSEPLTDFRAQLFTDDGQGIDLDFNVASATWRLAVDEAVSTATLSQLVTYLHEQFYAGEQELLNDWLDVVEGVKRGKKTTFTLKTVDRL